MQNPRLQTFGITKAAPLPTSFCTNYGSAHEFEHGLLVLLRCEMRNLALKNLDYQRLNNVNNCEVFCTCSETLFAYDRGIITKWNEKKEELICNLTDVLYPTVDAISRAVQLVYHYEKGSLCLMLRNGDIIFTETEKTGAETIVGSVDDGIKTAQWSPEQEVVAIVSTIDNVIVLTSDYEVVNEVSLHGGGFGEQQTVSVGWGRKETQFQGSAGKYVAKEQVEQVQLADNEDIHISWRGDAEYFAVSTVNPETRLRYLRIFSKSGVLQYTSEALNGLESCLDWCPSGNLIASTQKLPNKYCVCFFEKNGLKHGEFSPPLNTTTIITQVLWNNDSKILALLLTDNSEQQMSEHCGVLNEKFVLLYTVNNYKWYCKYKLTFKALDHPILVKWDHQISGLFHVISKCDNHVYYHRYMWNWTTNKSKICGAGDESFVAVIDGFNVQLTSFKRGIVPPPMCTYSITAPSLVNSVAFAPDSSNNLLLHLSNGDVQIYKFADLKTLTFDLIGTIKLINTKLEIYYNGQWIESNKLLLNMAQLNQGCIKHLMCLIDFVKRDDEIVFEKENFQVSSCVAMVRVGESGSVLYDNSGAFHLFRNKQFSNIVINKIKNVLDMDVLVKDGQLLIFIQESSGKFYINSKLLFNNITSFHIHGKFVLLTNLKHELLCLNSDDDLSCIGSLTEAQKRRVERGSRLVTSVQRDMKVILQMPRGNLECVQPRALSLHTVGMYLDSSRYDRAFDLMRKQRINLNLIHDHNPKCFSTNLPIFIEQIKDPNWISLFITDITEEDVTKTMYSAAYRGKNQLTVATENSKIDALCDMMEKALSTMKNHENYLLPLLTCHIKRNKIESLEKALSILKNLKEMEDRGEKPLVSFSEAFRYVLYLIDVEEIYKIALGMYDFDLVLVVAEKSQKDPKEYLPFLNSLRKLEPHYQRFTVDKYLKRYKKALTNLVLCDGDDRFNECLTFIKAHQLYKPALKLIPQNTDRYKRVCLSYAEDLIKSSLFEEAGIMYCNAGMYRNAIDAYRKSGNCHEILHCASELELPDKDINKLYLDVANDLIESKNYSMAATIYLDYLRDIEEGVKTLAFGKLFAEAYRISYLHNKPDLVTRVLVPIVIQQAHFTTLQIAQFKDTFTKQKHRLEVVRSKKLEDAGTKREMEVDSDVYSETSTVITQSQGTSRGTSRTYRSAKNKRKQERKLLSLKEGSPYEHLALIVSLHNVVTSSLTLLPEVKEINKFLVKINKYEMAERLQKDLEQFLETIEKSKSEIWTSDLLNNSKPNFGPDATSNDIASAYTKSDSPFQLLEPKYAMPPEIQVNKLKWKLDIIQS